MKSCSLEKSRLWPALAGAVSLKVKINNETVTNPNPLIIPDTLSAAARRGPGEQMKFLDVSLIFAWMKLWNLLFNVSSKGYIRFNEQT